MEKYKYETWLFYYIWKHSCIDFIYFCLMAENELMKYWDKAGYGISYTSIPFCSLENIYNNTYKTKKNYFLWIFYKDWEEIYLKNHDGVIFNYLLLFLWVFRFFFYQFASFIIKIEFYIKEKNKQTLRSCICQRPAWKFHRSHVICSTEWLSTYVEKALERRINTWFEKEDQVLLSEYFHVLTSAIHSYQKHTLSLK